MHKSGADLPRWSKFEVALDEMPNGAELCCVYIMCTNNMMIVAELHEYSRFSVGDGKCQVPPCL